MKKLITIQLLAVFAFAAHAQKLPNVQETSLRAPSDIKVDGKPDEWKNQFQAYNKATEIYYTISNDSKNLYLILQTTDIDIANKIICGGATFMINGSGKMKDQDGMAITFPALPKDPRSGGVGPGTERLPSNFPPIDYTQDGITMNEQFISMATDIKVTGIEGIPNILSIYNPEGIKAAAMFNEEKIFTCEMAIPLKYLKLTDNAKSLVYSIRLNGSILQNLRRALRGGITSIRVVNGVEIWEGPGVDQIRALIAPTNFWAEYVVVK